MSVCQCQLTTDTDHKVQVLIVAVDFHPQFVALLSQIACGAPMEGERNLPKTRYETPPYDSLRQRNADVWLHRNAVVVAIRG
jgi:hypothetical protein